MQNRYSNGLIQYTSDIRVSRGQSNSLINAVPSAAIIFFQISELCKS